MREQAENKFTRLMMVSVIIVSILIILVLNIWIRNSIRKTIEPSEFIAAVQKEEPRIQQYTTKVSPVISESGSVGEIIRKTRVQRAGDYTESFFYQDGKEIAKQKSTIQGTSEQSGKIPDGKVKFIDEYKNTYGEEYYRWGKKHGPSKTYYSTGQLKEDADYKLGELQTKKEYYIDAGLRFEVDYQDARDYKGDKEVGIGKLYYRNGILKYEWDLTNNNRTGFKKSYNTDGTLRVATYYDERGREIEMNK